MLLTALGVLLYSCSPREQSAADTRPTFKDILGMQYVEVDRYFDNGLSFNEQGYQLEPSWKLYFLSDDSVKIFHPQQEVYFNYPIHHDHDSVFNIARHWTRLKEINKDSIVLQLLSVEEKKISKELSNAYMKFYSHAYLERNKLNADSLRIPAKDDTAFIRKKSDRANASPEKRDFAFAARIPVILTSRVPEIEVTKLEVEDDPHDLMHKSPSDEYLYPEYRISIDKAYKDFSHSFSVLVDDKGKMRLAKFVTSPEFEESRRRVLEGIIEVYLQRFLEVVPGTTLGIPHTSEITLHVKGRKSAK